VGPVLRKTLDVIKCTVLAIFDESGATATTKKSGVTTSVNSVATFAQVLESAQGTEATGNSAPPHIQDTDVRHASGPSDSDSPPASFLSCVGSEHDVLAGEIVGAGERSLGGNVESNRQDLPSENGAVDEDPFEGEDFY
jgi:hypothetical protein